MYVIIKTLKVQKGLEHEFSLRFSQPSPVTSFPGFVKREVLISKKHPDYDEYRDAIYWESKQAFYRWEGSDLHIAMHKDKSNDHHKPLEGVIEVTRQAYELLTSSSHD